MTVAETDGDVDAVMEMAGVVVTVEEGDDDGELTCVTMGLSVVDADGLPETVAALDAGIGGAVVVGVGSAVLEAVRLGGSAPTVAVASAE